MNYYGGKELAAAFRTVRGNTVKLAEEVPEDKYGFRASARSRSQERDCPSLSRPVPIRAT